MASSSSSSVPATQDQEQLDLDKEIYELSAIVLTLDKILSSLNRLNQLVDPMNGELYQAQKKMELALSTSKLELVDANNEKVRRRGRPPKKRRVEEDPDFV